MTHESENSAMRIGRRVEHALALVKFARAPGTPSNSSVSGIPHSPGYYFAPGGF